MMASEEICSDSTPDFPPKCRNFGTLNAIILHLFGLKTVETLTLRGFILIQQALSKYSVKQSRKQINLAGLRVGKKEPLHPQSRSQTGSYAIGLWTKLAFIV